jgi:hypothetical protein
MSKEYKNDVRGWTLIKLHKKPIFQSYLNGKPVGAY